MSRLKALIYSFIISSIMTIFLMSDYSKNYYSYGKSMHIGMSFLAIVPFLSGFVMTYFLLRRKGPKPDKDKKKNHF